VHRVVAIPVPATSTDACIHVTSDESRKEHMNKPRASPPINITPPLTHCFLQRNDPGRRTPAYAIDRDLPRLSVIHEVGCRLPPHSMPSVRSLLAPRVSGARALILAACRRHRCRSRQWNRRYL